jgi:plastocyanin
MSNFRFALLLALPMCNTPAPPPAAATTTTASNTTMDAEGNAPSGPTADTSSAGAAALAPIQIEVDANGYKPTEVTAPAGKTVQLVFTRTSDEGCGQQLVFPSLNIKRDLPLNQPVNVEVTMPATGNITFTCGMDMYRGSIVAN